MRRSNSDSDGERDDGLIASLLRPIYNFLGNLPVLVVSFVIFSGTLFPFISGYISDISPELALGLRFLSFVILASSFIIRVWRTVEKSVSNTLNESRKEFKDSIINIATEALGPYGDISRIRGRDVFGPLMFNRDIRNEKVMAILYIHDVNGNFEYTLKYKIEFGDTLASPLFVESLIAPVYLSGSERYTCYRYDNPDINHFTVDFSPVVKIQKDISGLDVDDQLSEAEDFIDSNIEKLEVYPNTSVKKRNNKKLVFGSLEQEFLAPAKITKIPSGEKSVTIEVRHMKHPKTFDFRLSSPILTKKLIVICKTECSLKPKHFVNTGECPQVDRHRLPENQAPLSKISGSQEAKVGYSWTAEDDWVLTPADRIEISFGTS